MAVRATASTAVHSPVGTSGIRHPPVITLPGNAVGAGRALTVGENEFAPEVSPFSVGDGGVAVELEDGGVVTAGFSFAEHAVKNPMPISAAALAATAVRRTEVDDVMMEKPPWRPVRATVMVFCWTGANSCSGVIPSVGYPAGPSRPPNDRFTV